MARKFLTPINMGLNEIRSVLAEIIAGNPASPIEAQFWYNGTTDRLVYRDGNTTNRSLQTIDDAYSGGDLSGTYPNPAVVANAISNTKLADVPTATFKGRNTAGTGDPEDLTVAQAKVLLNLSGSNTGDQTITLTGDVTGSGTGSFTTAIAAGVIVNADINAAAAIAYSKLTLTNSIVNGDIAAGAAIAYTKLALSNSIVNADIAAGAAIALSKLATDPLARANHTGTQLASTISNFDTQVRTNRLDQMATPTATVSMGSQILSNVLAPSAATDAANKAYVDSVAQGLTTKAAVRAATTANITLSAPQTIDGISVIAGDRVLVKNQTAPAENGIYVVAAGAWTRALDMDIAAEFKGAFTFVEEGTTQANSGWTQTAEVVTVGTTAVTWAQFSGSGTYSAGNGLDLTGTSFSIDAALPLTVASGTLVLNYGQGLTLQGGTTISIDVTQGIIINGSNQLLVDASYLTGTLGFTKKVSFNSTAGTSTTCTHNLNSRDVTVEVYDATTYETVEADVVRTSVNVVTVTFASSVGASAYRIVVTG